MLHAISCDLGMFGKAKHADVALEDCVGTV